MLQDWPTVCLWPVFLSHAQMTLHIPSERSGSVSKPSRAHRAHANHLVFEAQVILINVFLVQYLSGQLRCFRVENVGEKWIPVRFHGPSDDDSRCAAVWMP